MKTTTSSATIQLLILLTLTSIPIPTSFAAPPTPSHPPANHTTIKVDHSNATSHPPPPHSKATSHHPRANHTTIRVDSHSNATSLQPTYTQDSHSNATSHPPTNSTKPSSTQDSYTGIPPPSPTQDSYTGGAATPPPIPTYPPPIPIIIPQPIPTSFSPPATTYPPPFPTTCSPPPPAVAYPPPVQTSYPPGVAYPPAPDVQRRPSVFSSVLNQLGYPALAAAATRANLSTAVPTTIFAPSDSSLLACPSCDLPLLLQEHSLPGLYSLHYLRSLAFGTKIETLAPNRCLTITATPSAATPAVKKVFINGVEITKPDQFNDGFLIIHGLQGFVSHLAAESCLIERQTTLAYPSQPLPTAEYHVSRVLLKDAMVKLRVSGYSVVALAMRVKYWELCQLKGLTIFALDDASIFAGGIGHAYVADIGYHIVPNRLLMAADLEAMPPLTAFPTMERWQSLVVTTASGGGPMVPMRINYVKIKVKDLVHNDRIVVHCVSMPFPHVDDPREYE